MSGRTLLWIGCGGCSGETQALLGVEGQAADLLDLIDVDGVRLLWHPSFEMASSRPPGKPDRPSGPGRRTALGVPPLVP